MPSVDVKRVSFVLPWKLSLYIYVELESAMVPEVPPAVMFYTRGWEPHKIKFRAATP